MAPEAPGQTRAVRTCNTSDTNDRHIVQINHHCSEGAPAGWRPLSFISRIFLILSCLVRGSWAGTSTANFSNAVLQRRGKRRKGDTLARVAPQRSRVGAGNLWPGAETLSGFLGRLCNTRKKNGDLGTTGSPNQNSTRQDALQSNRA